MMPLEIAVCVLIGDINSVPNIRVVGGAKNVVEKPFSNL